MGNPLASSQFIRLLDDQLEKVTSGFKDLPTMIDKFFKMEKSVKAWNDYYSVGTLGDIPRFNGSLSTLGRAPGFHTRIEPKEYAGEVKIERKLLDDDRYSIVKDTGNLLLKSASRTREKSGAKAFNNAFSTAFDFMSNEEGVALCSDSHITKSGTSTATGFDNAGTSALSPVSLAATRILMMGFRDDRSQRIDISENLKLVVPNALADRAMEINGTAKELDSANNNKNMQMGRYEVIPYLRLDDNDTNNWFMVDGDSMKDNLMWLDRISPEVKRTSDWNTYQLQVALYMRYGYGWTDWRWIFGHNVS